MKGEVGAEVRGRRAVLLLVAGVAVIGPACSLLVDTSGLATAGDADAGIASGDAKADGAAGGDGATDGGTEAGRFCDSHKGAAVCIDFDDGGSVPAYFGGATFDSRVTSTIDPGVAPESPSLSFDYPGGTLPNGALEHFAYVKPVVTVPKVAHFSTRLRIDRIDAVHAMRPMEIDIHKNGGLIAFFVQTWGTGTNLYGQVYNSSSVIQSSFSGNFAQALPIGKWSTVRLDVDVGSSPGKVTVFVDDLQAIVPLTFDSVLISGGAPEVDLNLTRFGANGEAVGATTFHFDDVLLEIE